MPSQDEIRLFRLPEMINILLSMNAEQIDDFEYYWQHDDKDGLEKLMKELIAKNAEIVDDDKPKDIQDLE